MPQQKLRHSLWMSAPCSLDFNSLAIICIYSDYCYEVQTQVRSALVKP